MATTPLALLMLSFALGLRHALDVDHLAAVAVMASDRKGGWSASVVAALWGLGHTAALVVVATAVVVFRVRIPSWLAGVLELCVAVMLIALGGRLLWSLRAGAVVHFHPHAHGGRMHAHPHVHVPGAAHPHPHAHAAGHDADSRAARAWRRPLLVGLMHGMAGSAGLMVLVLATIPSPALALAYVGIFGVGTIAGMMLMSALVGVPLGLSAARFARVTTATRVGAALASVAVGLALAWRIIAERGAWI